MHKANFSMNIQLNANLTPNVTHPNTAFIINECNKRDIFLRVNDNPTTTISAPTLADSVTFTEVFLYGKLPAIFDLLGSSPFNLQPEALSNITHSPIRGNTNG